MQSLSNKRIIIGGAAPEGMGGALAIALCRAQRAGDGRHRWPCHTGGGSLDGHMRAYSTSDGRDDKAESEGYFGEARHI